jgi:hypothetical protein
MLSYKFRLKASNFFSLRSVPIASSQKRCLLPGKYTDKKGKDKKLTQNSKIPENCWKTLSFIRINFGLMSMNVTANWNLLSLFFVEKRNFTFYKPFYIFDRRSIESSMLFAVFCPSRTPVLSNRSSYNWARRKGFALERVFRTSFGHYDHKVKFNIKYTC